MCCCLLVPSECRTSPLQFPASQLDRHGCLLGVVPQVQVVDFMRPELSEKGSYAVEYKGLQFVGDTIGGPPGFCSMQRYGLNLRTEDPQAGIDQDMFVFPDSI